MKLFIANANIVSENEVLPNCSLFSENGQIVDFGKIKAPSDAKVIDAKGALLLPAFVDIHTHGCLNCDFSDGDIFGFEKIAEQKLKEGDEITQTIEATNASDLLFFSNKCQVYKNKTADFALISSTVPTAEVSVLSLKGTSKSVISHSLETVFSLAVTESEKISIKHKIKDKIFLIIKLPLMLVIKYMW